MLLKGALKARTQTGSSTYNSSASQMQADTQMDPLPETDNNELLDDADNA